MRSTNVPTILLTIFLLAGLLQTAFVPPPAAAQTPEPKKHPLLEPYEGSVLTRREEPGHLEYKIVTAIDLQGNSDEQVIKTLPVPGKLTRLYYENPKDRSPVEIFTNYKEAFQREGFQILFECGDKDCGPSYASSRWTRVNGMRIVSSPMWYFSAKKLTSDMETYVAISVVKDRHQVDVLEAKEMEKGKVGITSEALRKEMVAEGKAVLAGLYFDPDSAVLSEESRPALQVIAEFLKADHGLKVYIVGHTDMDGTLEHNMVLSRDRAQAVVDALTNQYGISGHMLAAYGVGPLSPAKPNRASEGKAENRRVEMVER